MKSRKKSKEGGGELNEIKTHKSELRNFHSFKECLFYCFSIRCFCNFGFIHV